MIQGSPLYRSSSTHYGHKPVIDFTRAAALRSLGPVLYAVRLDAGIIKIGFTRNLHTRERSVRKDGKSKTCEILAFMPGTLEQEQAIHARLVEHRAHGWEYYHPTPEVLAEVNAMRDGLHLPHVGKVAL